MVSYTEFDTMASAAVFIVHDSKQRDELLRLFFTQLAIECRRAKLEPAALLLPIIDELGRLTTTPARL